MLEYQGQPCMICGKVFAEGDDIVTCPECGTPYHRGCWKEVGHCVNESLHVSGGSWMLDRKKAAAEERSAAKREEEAQQAADRERGDQPQMINAGLYDGVRLNPADPCIGLDPDEPYGDATMRDVADFVSTNKFYYLPLFHFMKKTGRKFSFNLLSLFFPELYFANRRMWAMSIVTICISVALRIPHAIVTFQEMTNLSVPGIDSSTEAFQTIYSACSISWMVIQALCCIFANYLYYRFTVRRVNSIRKSAPTEETAAVMIRGAGGTSLGNVFLALIMKAALLFSVMALLLMPR